MNMIFNLNSKEQKGLIFFSKSDSITKFFQQTDYVTNK